MTTKEARIETIRIATDIMEIKGVDQAARRAKAMLLHPRFADDHPLFFEVLIKDGKEFDIVTLKFMMAQIDAVQGGDMTSDDAKDTVIERLTSHAPQQ